MKNKENISKLAKSLIAHRKSMGLTQIQIAEAVGIKRSTYAYYERETMPSVEIIEKLAKIYNTTPGQLMFPNDYHEGSMRTLHDDDAFEMPKIEFATLTEREQNFLIKTRLLTEAEKQALIDKLDELLSHNE